MQVDDLGRCFWDRGDSDLNTAFAALALLASGDHLDIADCAIDYLISRQNSGTGAWEAGVFFRGRFETGLEAVWVSEALTTAMALEALCKR